MEGNYEYHEILEEHHPFGGRANRKISDKFGLKGNLCLKHHRGDINGNKEAVHHNRENDLKLKRYFQEIFEKTHTREEFRSIFGKSWL